MSSDIDGIVVPVLALAGVLVLTILLFARIDQPSQTGDDSHVILTCQRYGDC